MVGGNFSLEICRRFCSKREGSDIRVLPTRDGSGELPCSPGGGLPSIDQRGAGTAPAHKL
jgi:hypothetical protein